MPRPLTGSIKRHGDHFDARITLPDGTRPWIHLPAGETEARARARAASMSEKAKTGEAVLARVDTKAKAAPAPAGETFRAYSDRWVAERDARGLISAHDDRSRLKVHILPLLGDRPIRDITKTDLEALVEHLDGKIQADETSWLTAQHVWALCTKLFGDACGSKVKTLRARESNPAIGVRGPDRGAEKAKGYLYPSEFVKLAACEAVPLLWRRVYALSIYLYVRAGELEALGLEDSDPDRGIVHVHRGIDRQRKREKSTKGKQSRRFSVELEILPLMRIMHSEARAAGAAKLVQAMPPCEDLSESLRAHLHLAGVDRAELFVDSKTAKQITFHDLRATGLTWMAVRGDDPLKIKHRAGHVDFKTTERYIRTAEAVREGFGTVFPSLPVGLLGEFVAGTNNVPPSTPPHAESSSESSESGGAEGSDPGESSMIPSAPGTNRTCDLRFRKPLLYPLSYGGKPLKRLANLAHPAAGFKGHEAVTSLLPPPVALPGGVFPDPR